MYRCVSWSWIILYASAYTSRFSMILVQTSFAHVEVTCTCTCNQGSVVIIVLLSGCRCKHSKKKVNSCVYTCRLYWLCTCTYSLLYFLCSTRSGREMVSKNALAFLDVLYSLLIDIGIHTCSFCTFVHQCTVIQ